MHRDIIICSLQYSKSMKAHTGMKILVLGVELAVVGLLIFSFYPIMDGGLDLDAEEELSAQIDEDTGEFELSGSVRVTSKMPWDINLSYRIMIGTGDNIVAQTELVEVTIPTNDSAVLGVELRASVFNIVLLMLDNGLDENGDLGDMNLPVTLQMSGSYINKMVSMDLDVHLESLSGLIDGSVVLSPDGKTLTANGIKFTPPGFLGDLSGGFNFSIPGTPGITGNLNFGGSGGESTLDFEMTSGEELVKALTDALNSDGTLTMDVDGENITLNADDAQLFVGLLTSICDKLGGA